jgi:hypothetical protein
MFLPGILLDPERAGIRATNLGGFRLNGSALGGKKK